MSKKEKRWENKKSKVKAFLDVAKLNDKDKEKASKVIDDIKESVCPNNNNKMADDNTSDQSATADDIQLLKKQYRERRKQNMQKSKVYGTLEHVNIPCDVCPQQTYRKPQTTAEESLDIIPEVSTTGKQPLFAVDLQHLILYGVVGITASYRPRWCKLIRPEKLAQVVVLEMKDVTKEMFLENQDSLDKLKELGFTMCVEVISPSQYNSSFLADIVEVPISNTMLRKQEKKTNDKPVLPKSQTSKPRVMLQSTIEGWACQRTDLILSTKQMIMEAYPMPIGLEKYPDYIFTSDNYERVTENSPLFALDCEMCQTKGGESELTYVSIVNEQLETVYLTLVKPRTRIVDYLTKYSGVTKKLLKNVTTRLEDVQQRVREILPPDAVLCGQSFCSDLKALKMFHPYVIDTSFIYNLSGNTFMKPSLKRLAQMFLNKSIQDDPTGHSPEQDARATMELVLLKLKNGIAFGDVTKGTVGLDSSEDSGKQNGTNQAEVKDVFADIRATEITKRQKEDNEDDGPAKKKQKKSDSESSSSSEEDEDDLKETKKKKKKSKEKEDVSSSASEEESETSNESKKKKKKDDSSEMEDGEIAESLSRQEGQVQKFVFFKSLESHKSESLFNIANESGKNVLVAGPESLMTGLPDPPESCELRTTETNPACTKVCKRAVRRGTKLVWGQFTFGSQEDEKQAIFSQLQRTVAKVTKKCPPSSLVMVLLSGGTEATSLNNAVCLVKVT